LKAEWTFRGEFQLRLLVVMRRRRANTKKSSKKTPWCSCGYFVGFIGIGVVLLLACLNIQCLVVKEDVCGIFQNIVIPNVQNSLLLVAPQATTTTLPTAQTVNASTIASTKNTTTFNKKELLIQRMLQTMNQHNLTRSARHEQKFHVQKQLLRTKFSESKLYSTKVDNFAAIPINDDYAYMYVCIISHENVTNCSPNGKWITEPLVFLTSCLLFYSTILLLPPRHIWKCGGTTMERQTKKSQTNLASLTQPYYMTFVRNPFDHFLSGWAECGHRDKTTQKKDRITKRWDNPKRHYNTMIMDWLNHTKAIVATQSGCMKHSFPQANSLMALGKKGEEAVFDELVLVADLNELGGILEHVLDLPYDSTVDTGRNSSAAKYKRSYFPPRIDWLSDDSIRAVCEFLALDYFLFDFEPPEPCGFLKDYY
jgi:hypothetical protein